MCGGGGGGGGGGSKAKEYPNSEFPNKILIITNGYLECGAVTHHSTYLVFYINQLSSIEVMKYT